MYLCLTENACNGFRPAVIVPFPSYRMVHELLSSHPSHHTGWFPTCCHRSLPIIQDGFRLAVIVPFPSSKKSSLLENGD
ncbi:hypothetical protein DPMN_166679 [Dreissena polymorpha]|uniref:Uncharacterized protein n=1 Tax=Dreissena polymorpha TaxID=45954 RepID=A0A9D4EZF1_DREPO|nr:hypothetical protein DPMN_166679 [Dreissena polymorpha]